MKRNQIIRTWLVAASLLAALAATAQQPATNRLTFSARFGLNISAKFSGATPVAIPPNSRTTPNNDLYNYDNGYVRPDINAVEYGNNDGLTWYVGYDNFNGQPSPNDQVDEATHSLLFSRSAGPATLRTPSMDDDLSPGAELTYTHELRAGERFRLGFEAAANYLNLGLHAHNAYALRGPVENHAYSYYEGTTPPTATPNDPYLGAYQWGNFTIFSDYTALPNTEASVGTVTGSRDLDANLWGGRLGPYAEFNLSSNVCVSLSGGLAIGWLDADVAWNETVTFTGGVGLPSDVGSGSDNELLWGGYVAANLHWQLSDRWSAAGSLQFQSLGQYDETFASRRVELDLSKSFFVAIGLSYDF